MKKIFFIFLVIPFLAVNISGCAAVIVGSAVGAVGGYAVSRDTIQGDSDKSYDNIWNAALDLAKIRGTMKEEDYVKGNIHFVALDSSLVWIRLIRMTRATTRLKVSARRFHLPNLDLAQELYTKIMEEAK